MTRLLIGGIGLLAAYEGIRQIGPAFVSERDQRQHPILPLLAYFAAAFAIYYWSIRALEKKAPDGVDWRLVSIVLFALLFRGQMLATPLILERDVYRYVWDGDIARLGVDPFGQSPEAVAKLHLWLRVQAVPPNNHELHPTWIPVIRSANALAEDPRMRATLERVYYPSVPTIYPPASQLVFQTLCTMTHGLDSDATVDVFRAVFALLDIACGLAVIVLCKQHGIDGVHAMLYLWCPLAVKEFANSGHMDVLANLPLLLALIAWSAFERSFRLGWLALSGALIGIAICAKLYAAVLVPLFGVRLWCFRAVGHKRSRVAAFGWWFAGLTLSTSVFFGPAAYRWSQAPPNRGGALTAIGFVGDQPRLDLPFPSTGMLGGAATFSTQWEMNAFLFAAVRATAEAISGQSSVDSVEPGRWARGIVALAIVYVLALVAAKARSASSKRFLELVFLSLAWFWLLSPTLNPWYLAWFLPLLPFVGNRCWHWLPAFAMLYYMRFWFDGADPWHGWLASWGLPTGARFFDDVFVFLEFGPWFACLLWNNLRSSGQMSVDGAPCGSQSEERV